MNLQQTKPPESDTSATFHQVFNHRLRPASGFSPGPHLLHPLTSMQMQPIGCLFIVLLWESWIDSYSNGVGFPLRVCDRILLKAPPGLPPTYSLFNSLILWSSAVIISVSVTLNSFCNLVIPVLLKTPSSHECSRKSSPMSRTLCLAVCWRECQYFQFFSCSSLHLSSPKTTMITL